MRHPPSELRADAGRVFTGPQAAEAAQITYRQLDHWARRGWVAPSEQPSVGRGTPRLYSVDDVLRLAGLGHFARSGSRQQVSVLGELMSVVDLRDAAWLVCKNGASIETCVDQAALRRAITGEGVYSVYPLMSLREALSSVGSIEGTADSSVSYDGHASDAAMLSHLDALSERDDRHDRLLPPSESRRGLLTRLMAGGFGAVCDVEGAVHVHLKPEHDRDAAAASGVLLEVLDEMQQSSPVRDWAAGDVAWNARLSGHRSRLDNYVDQRAAGDPQAARHELVMLAADIIDHITRVYETSEQASERTTA